MIGWLLKVFAPGYGYRPDVPMLSDLRAYLEDGEPTVVEPILREYGWWRWPISWNAGSDKIARGKRWQAFYNEEGGLKDVIADLRRGYFIKAGHLKPNDLAGLQALSLADRILAEIDGTFQLIIVEGDAEEQAIAHAEKIARLPEPMRRRL